LTNYENILLMNIRKLSKNHFKSYLEKIKYKYNNNLLLKFQEYIHTDLYINDNLLNINDTILSELLIENDE